MTAIETSRTRIVPLTRLAHCDRAVLGLAARADRVRGRRGCRRWRCAPFDVWPLLFLTFPVLVWLIDGAAAGRLGGVPSAAIAGWWFGFGYFLAGLYWVGNAFLVDAKTFGWLLPFAVIGLPAGMALLHRAWACARARLLWTRGPRRGSGARGRAHHRRMAARPSVHRLSLERLRLCADRRRSRWRKARRWSALWGLTFLAVAVFASPAVLADDRADTRRPWLPLALARRRCSPRSRGYGTHAAVAHADRVRRRRAAAHHAAQPAAGREVQLRRQAAGDEPLSRRCRTARPGRSRPACAT